MKSALFVCVCVIALATFSDAKIYRKNWKGTSHKLLDLVGAPKAEDPPAAKPMWFYSQKLDHFDKQNRATWKQQFFVNDTFFERKADGSTGPVFLLLGGEGPETPASVGGHFIFTDQAANFGALAVALEHRFYGASQPFPDTSTANLRFLTSQQALADAAYFKDYLSNLYNIPASSKWIVFGGSYSGNLSAWLRLKYPHLFAGAIASSAPLRAQLEFAEYFEVVAASLGPVCSKILTQATRAAEDMLASSTGRRSLERMFNTCTPIRTSMDLVTFLEAMADPICEVVQYNRDNNMYAQAFDIPKVCHILEASSSDPLQGLANFVQAWNEHSKQNCTAISYNDYIEELRDTSLENTAARCWTYQTCTEFGYYQTGKSSNQPFSSKITLDWFLQQCTDIFGQALRPDIDETNDFYGATNITTSNTAFSNGSIDPWHALGMQPGTSPHNVAIVMNGTAHCADLYPKSDSDLDDLTATRQVEAEMLRKWLVASV
mmetsp:Transcript_47357/g.119285  ORF Transcript_47357/g.119285 Transcript_47357/m.119285 type:complete len:490 (-) Transcript_47357:88-1557(-)